MNNYQQALQWRDQFAPIADVVKTSERVEVRFPSQEQFRAALPFEGEQSREVRLEEFVCVVRSHCDV